MQLQSSTPELDLRSVMFSFQELTDLFILSVEAERMTLIVNLPRPVGESSRANGSLLNGHGGNELKARKEARVLPKQWPGSNGLPGESNYTLGELPENAFATSENRFVLERIDWEHGSPVRFYPFSRNRIGKSSPRLIAIDPRYCFGTPFIVGHTLRTDVVAGRFRAGESVSELTADLAIPAEEIEEAIRYESGFEVG
jgi:uncharacterized protein (DUF433 family)